VAGDAVKRSGFCSTGDDDRRWFIGPLFAGATIA